jgi:rhodanese-related sulfurtransferase
MTKSAVEMVKEAKTRIANLTAEQVASELAKGNAVLVDLREPEQRIQNGAIPGAISAPRGKLEFYDDPTSAYHRPEFDPAHRIILYCASGGRSALATDMLQQMGYSNIGHLDGGIKAWKEAGQPLSNS